MLQTPPQTLVGGYNINVNREVLMIVSYYQRIENDSPFGCENVVGSKSLAYLISEQLDGIYDEYIPESFAGSHPIHFVDVAVDESYVMIDGCVIDVDNEMYDEEELDEMNKHHYKIKLDLEINVKM